MSTLHAPGDIITNRYRMIATLGNPHTSNTYVADDLVQDKLVAIKAISLWHMKGWKDLELLERQANVLSHLNHPGVPKHIKYFQIDTESDRSFYLVQQLIEGSSLAQLIQGGWRSDETEVRDIALQALEILQYLHERTPPIIHRDVEPCNLLRGTDGRIYLVDFGSVKAPPAFPQHYSSTLVGAHGYVSPEQSKGKAGFASDLYSLGASLLFVLTGASPDELWQGERINLQGYVQLSSHFTSWLLKMLEPSLETRFHSAAEAISALCNSKGTTSPNRQKRSSPQPKQAAVTEPTQKLSASSRPQQTIDVPLSYRQKRQPAGSRVILKRTSTSLVVEIPPEDDDRRSTMKALNWPNRLTISSQRFVISQRHRRFQTLQTGETDDLIKAEMRVELDLWGRTKHTLLIWEGITDHTFASELTPVEKEWLVYEITDFLNYLDFVQHLEKLVDEN